ncbi:hypothetical protein [Burkholderia ubonensis]|uniref:Uncharacterized protein n=1 Tax=Burkholderia ubonensis subsp. mesacidophila TaxID=265293 RepID=A0A2A4FM76_9BURK|nr:hypothetical protein [Burkholderia ubonensis]PCE33772.1 hypothetical protein BZL54_03355 [Burkholderia ubonensis subsp. mesacidophila]
MAVDFDKLPPEKPEPDDPPSRVVWAIVFCVIVVAGIFTVLLLWPEGEPTQTPWFWTCITAYPVGVATFVVLRRYSVYEGRRSDVIEWNKACTRYVNGVFEQASRPLAVVAAAYRFSSDAKENEFDKLLAGSVKLEPRTTPKPDTPPVTARWFEEPHADKEGKPFKTDSERYLNVLESVFGALITDVAEAVRALPSDLKLAVGLVLPEMANTAEASDAWDKQWRKSDLRLLKAEVLPEPPELMYFDTWLDRSNQGSDQEARLLVFVQLNPLLQALPPEGCAEAAVAILVTPEDVRSRFKLASIALAHRPNETYDCSLDVALSRALRWGRLEAADVSRIWQGGLGAATGNEVTAVLVKAGIAAKLANLDFMIGHAGKAAVWFGVACAAKAVAHDGSSQLFITGGERGPCFSVVRNINSNDAGV